jgi:hypothetical protein
MVVPVRDPSRTFVFALSGATAGVSKPHSLRPELPPTRGTSNLNNESVPDCSDCERGRFHVLRPAWTDVEEPLQEFRVYLARIREDEGQQEVKVRWIRSPTK